MQGAYLQRVKPSGPDNALQARITFSDRLLSQPLLGLITGITALTAVVGVWKMYRPPPLGLLSSALVVTLTVLVISSRLLPITIGRSTKLYIASVPLYFLICLFPPAVAATAVSLGMFVGEAAICRRCGNTVGDILSQVGRWALLGLAVSTMIYIWPVTYQAWAYVLAVVLLWAGDVVTSPLVLSPMTGLRPLMVMSRITAESCVGELSQYFIAMLAVLLLRTRDLWTGNVWVSIVCAILLAVPMFLLYLYLKSVDDDLQGVG